MLTPEHNSLSGVAPGAPRPVTFAEFKTQIEAVAQRALVALKDSPGKTAWDLKIELKVTHTTLHLALGVLLERGAVQLKPDRLTYTVEPAASAAQPSSGPVAAPA